jgi:5,10-methylene-tetrahydrofolate dehydrogenase/methenyl tetrahydrofolate cyclohydrolase
MIIDGKKIANDIVERLAVRSKPRRFLAAVLVGDDPASISFLKQKEKTAQKLGVDFRLFQFPATVAKDVLRLAIKKMGNDPACGGIILQLPLPNREDELDVLSAISRVKDVDVLGKKALDAFRAGTNAILPPAVGVVSEILAISNIPASERRGSPNGRQYPISKFAIVGAGKLVGQPIAIWLTGKAKEVIVLDKGDDLNRLKDADVVISGTGVPGLIKPDMLKENALVIDFGYGERIAGSGERRVSGDFDANVLEIENCKIAKLNHTPTPGGTGPILVAKLFENFYDLNK